MPTFQGTPEEYARMVKDAIERDGFQAFYTTENYSWGWQTVYDDRTAHLINRNNAINLIRCSDGVYRPERKPSPMSGLWGFGGMFNTTGN